MKNHKNADFYDFSDYAEEITGDALFKINGGAEVENSDKGVAGAKPGDTITRKNGDVIVLKQADIDYANAQLENNVNNGTGNTSGSSGAGSSSGTYSGTTSSSSGTGGGSVSGGTTSSSGSCSGSVSVGTPSGPTGPSGNPSYLEQTGSEENVLSNEQSNKFNTFVPEYDLTKDTEILKKVIDERLDYDLDLQEYVKNDPRFNELLNNLFSDKMRSLVGTPYLFGGKNLKGIDCSGTITYALEDLFGIDLENYSSSQMANNKCPYVKINKSVNTNEQGKAGMLNFYIWNSGEGVKHVNSGVGKKQEEDNYQVVDATEGAWMVNRNSNSMQKIPAQAGTVNQTYVPYINNRQPSYQGEINWTFIKEEIWPQLK